jgi:hypothetical protein
MAKSTAAKKSTNGRKPNALHTKLIALMARKDGATLTDIKKAGWKFPAIVALKIAERRGYKVSVKKPKPGELTRYVAKAGAAK